MTVDSLEVRRVLVEVHLVAIARGIAPEIFRPVIADVEVILRVKRDEADVAGLSGAARVIRVKLIAVQSDERIVCQVVVRDERLMIL